MHATVSNTPAVLMLLAASPDQAPEEEGEEEEPPSLANSQSCGPELGLM